MYDKELMMAIVGSSTTLAGLSAVVIGQVVQSRIYQRTKLHFRLAFSATFVLAIMAVISAMDWLVSPERVDKWLAFGFFIAQLILFTVVIIFWFWEKE
jgi:hypothetical protein